MTTSLQPPDVVVPTAYPSGNARNVPLDRRSAGLCARDILITARDITRLRLNQQGLPMRALLQLFVGLWLPSQFKNRALSVLGHDIHPTARVAPILLLGTTTLTVKRAASIGALTSFRSVNAVLEESSEVGQLNWISAAPFLVSSSDEVNAGCFTLGAHASFTNRHYVDASGGVVIGEFATVAGVRSVLMTHGIDVTDATLVTRGIRVGEYSMVGSTTSLVPGSSVPDYAVVAMGSVVVAGLDRPCALYAGTPAEFKKDLNPDARYFTRLTGTIPPRDRRVDANHEPAESN